MTDCGCEKARAELEEYLHHELCREDAADIREHMENCADCRGEYRVGIAITEVVQRDVMGDLDYRTGWVATVIKSGPLLGLFGTVLGMMAAFGRIGTGEKVQPSMIAAEISVALICTAMGLATAIPFNFMLNSLNARIRTFQDALSAGLVRVLDALRRSK